MITQMGSYTELRIPGLVATEQNTLMAYCECRKGQSDWADIDLRLCRSTDLGKTWQQVLLLEGGGDTLNNPVMFVDGSTLVFLFCKNYIELWQCCSYDDGLTFTQPQPLQLTNTLPGPYTVLAVGPGHGIRLGQRLLVPLWYCNCPEDLKSHRPSWITTLYSDDHGGHWQVGEAIFPRQLHNPSECALAVLDDGRVLISIRHEGEPRARALATSADGSSGWQDLRFAEALPDPVCMGSMTHREGTVYHLSCHSVRGRKNLTLSQSRDGFATQQDRPVSQCAGYSDLALVGDRIFIYHELTDYDGQGKFLPIRLQFLQLSL